MSLVKKCSLLVLLTQALVLTAAENDGNGWSLRLGASYRIFDEVDFGSSTFRNWQNGLNTTGQLGIEDWTAAFVPFMVPTPVIHEVQYQGGAAEIDDDSGLAPVVGVSKDLFQAGSFIWSFVANLQYYSPNLNERATGTMRDPGNFTAYTYTYNELFPGLFFPTQTAAPIPLSGPVNFSVRNQFEMDLWVFDLGLEARKEFDCFAVNFAFGPTLNIADVEAGQTQYADWYAQPPYFGAGSLRNEISDSETDLVPGLYGAVGVSLNLSENWGLGAEYRYDWVNEKPGTDQAQIDLSGHSAQLKVIYKF